MNDDQVERPSDEELKRIHGEDVELGIDDSEDDKLVEHEALKQADEQGIKFKDRFLVVKVYDALSRETVATFDTEEEANQHLASLDNPGQHMVMQERRQVTENE